jgi:hypothetical protein
VKRTKLLTAALVIAIVFTIANPALANRDPGMGGMYGPMPPRVGQAGAGGQYRDGMNLYQYVRSNPITRVDPDGLWGRETHWGDPDLKRVKGTYDIAVDIGYSDKCARVLADWDQGVDDVTPAWLFPQYHFEPGRASNANSRWNKGVDKLKRANVYESPWIWDVSVTDGLAHIGEALHGYQDSFAHVASHDADTPWKHVTGPNEGHYDAALAARTRFHKEGDSLNYRPDDPDLWPADHAATVADTKAKLEEIWKIPSIQCHCKKK